MPITTADHHWMAQALQWASKGRYITTPNPSVGCVLVKNEQLIGAGHSQVAGQAHAEVMALRMAGEQARGATTYVTLEPCSHFGRTPPCCDALVQAGVARVVVALQDPNPQVAGQGLARLRAAGITVDTGVLAEAARQHHRGFLSRMTRQKPWVTLKVATTLDGKTALLNGASQWITSPAARADVQQLRARSCAILTGSGTVLADDPQLTIRHIDGLPWQGRQPLAVVVDSQLRTPQTARLLLGRPSLLAHGVAKPSWAAPHAELLYLPDPQGRVDLHALLQALAVRGCNELLVEAGSILNGALLRAGLVDEVILYLAPKLFGHHAQGAFNWPALEAVDQHTALQWIDCRHIGPDLRLTAIPTTH